MPNVSFCSINLPYRHRPYASSLLRTLRFTTNEIREVGFLPFAWDGRGVSFRGLFSLGWLPPLRVWCKKKLSKSGHKTHDVLSGPTAMWQKTPRRAVATSDCRTTSLSDSAQSHLRGYCVVWLQTHPVTSHQNPPPNHLSPGDRNVKKVCCV